MKKLVFAFLVLVIAGSSYAVSIDVQDSVPANTVWSFSVRLPSATDFDDARVELDGSRIISFYTSPSNEIVAYDEDLARIFSSTEPDGSRVYFLVSPLAKGTHDLRLEVDGETIQEREVLFFEIFDADEQGDLKSRLDSLRGTMNSVVEQVNGFEERLSEALTDEDRQELQSSINSMRDSVTGLETRLGQQESRSETRMNVLVQNLEAQKARINDLNKPGLFGIGFASLGGIGSGLQGIGILVVVVIAAAVLVAKFRDRIPLQKGLYGKPGKEAGFSKKDKDIAEQVMNEAREEKSRGKWAFGNVAPVKKESKRFSVGDLIKK